MLIQDLVILAALAAETPPTQADSSATASTSKPEIAVDADSGTGETRFISRHRPRPNELVLGVFAGVLAPSSRIDLGDPAVGDRRYDRVAPEIGLRLGFYPSRFFGLEGELGLLPTRAGGERAVGYTARAHGVLQAGWWRVTPFVLLGGGVLGVTSGDAAAGDDADAALHVGGGVKLNATKRLAVRLDVRDVISPGDDSRTRPSHNPEAILGLEVRFGFSPKAAPVVAAPEDRDADGVADTDDWCPFEAGSDGRGCPFGDGDCDGVTDDADRCPSDRGAAPDGCPPPDRDGDSVPDADDACADEAGPAPEGCPDRDPDRDGVDAPDDRCPEAPETMNGFQDADGCPDELPKAVEEFSGVIEGIRFDNGKATIQRASEPLLRRAAEVLGEYPDLRLRISGHTDDRGDRQRNLDLSRARADAVKTYLVQQGVAPERLETGGVGPDAPIADNAKAQGRAKNRRIEFEVLR